MELPMERSSLDRTADMASEGFVVVSFDLLIWEDRLPVVIRSLFHLL